MRRGASATSAYPVDPLLGARVRFRDRGVRGWPWVEGVVVDVPCSLIVRVAGAGVHIVPRETARIVRTVLQGEVFW